MGLAAPSNALLRATGLGWFGVGLGLAQLIAPRAVGRTIGVGDSRRTRALLMGYGGRELTTGLGLVLGRKTATWMWARVAGHALDLATLGFVIATAKRRTARTRAINAAAVMAGVTAHDVLTAVELARHPSRQAAKGIEVRGAVTVNRSPAEVYDYWRKLENLPRFMAHLESVESRGSRSTWRAKAPLGKTVEWQAEITEDIPYEKIAWCSLPGSTVPNHGSVRFRPAPGNRGTEVLVSLKYDIPGRALGRGVVILFGEEPSIQVHSDLQRFKQMMELGDVIDSGNGNGRQVHP
jgi:uncharacterized membrane protein